jgi:hypothetical protein
MSAVELIKNFQATLPAPASGSQSKARFGIELGKRLGGKFLKKLVEARSTRRSKRFQVLMLIIRKTDRQSTHFKTSLLPGTRLQS